MQANPSYWRGAPPFPRVEMRPVPSEETRIADVRTARADIARVTLTDTAGQPEGRSTGERCCSPRSSGFALLELNAPTGPTKDVLRVRQAIAHAIDPQPDRRGAAQGLYKGSGRPLSGRPISAGRMDCKGYDYDPAKAKALLKEIRHHSGNQGQLPHRAVSSISAWCRRFNKCSPMSD